MKLNSTSSKNSESHQQESLQGKLFSKRTQQNLSSHFFVYSPGNLTCLLLRQVDGKLEPQHRMKEGDGRSIWNLFFQSDRVYSFQMYARSQDAIINDLFWRHFSKKLQPELLYSSNTHKKKNQTKEKLQVPPT